MKLIWCEHTCTCARILTSSVSFTRRICSLRSWRSLKVDCAVMEYTRAKPWPFFMYKSLIAVNCSYKTENEEEEEAMSSVIYRLTFIVQVHCMHWRGLLWDSVDKVDAVTDTGSVFRFSPQCTTTHSIVQCGMTISTTISTTNMHQHVCWSFTIILHIQEAYPHSSNTLVLQKK